MVVVVVVVLVIIHTPGSMVSSVCMQADGFYFMYFIHRLAQRRVVCYDFFVLRRLTEPPSERAEVARLGWFVGRDVRGRAVLARVVMDGMTRQGRRKRLQERG